jgi:hypothetical protein
MADFEPLLGTQKSLFHIGGPNGPIVNNNSGALESKNAANSAFVTHSAADPTLPDHLATKRYADSVAGPQAGAIRVAIGVSNVSSTSSLPAGAVVTNAKLDIQTAYSAGATIQVGISGQPALFMDTGDSSPQTPDIYDLPQDSTFVGAASPVTVTFGGTPTAGAGFAIVNWVLPSA